MSKIVRLTEKDLSRLVKKIVKESDNTPFGNIGHGWYDKDDYPVDDEMEYSEEREFGPDEYDDFMEYINDCNTKWCITTKKYYDEYQQRSGTFKIRK
jgi:hypothetical protein